MAKTPEPESASLLAARRARVPAAEHPKGGLAATLVTAAILIAALYFGREVFIPIVLAILFSFVLGPLVSLLRRARFPRILAVTTAVLLALGILLSLGGIIGTQVASLVGDIPRYRTTIEEKVSSVREGTVGRVAGYARTIGAMIRRAGEEGPPAPGTTANPEAGAAAKPMLVEVRERDPTPLQLAEQILSPVLHPLATVGIVFVVLIFILAQREDLRDRMIRLFGSSDLHRTTTAMNDAASRLSRYFVTQLALNAVFGLVIGVGLWLIGVPSPVLWGVVAGLMRFVPYIGAVISALPPLALAAAVDPGWTMVIATLALFLVLEPLMGHGIEPLVYGQSTGLSPFAVLVAAVFWTWLWGPVGLLLATPLTVCVVVLGRHVEQLEFLDVLFGDRPALTPVENFYQRILADDPDEAQEHAEQILKDCSLSAYYDDVALKALQLAAGDSARGVLGPQQLDRIRETITELVSDLADRADIAPGFDIARAGRRLAGMEQAEPAPDTGALEPDAPPVESLGAPWRGEGAVLCIAGRGPLDEAASMMLSQLLLKHGLGATIVPHAKVSRGRAVDLDMQAVRMICISYLELAGSPAHLRYLVRRLQQKAPGVPILVGLWPSEDPLLKDAGRRTSLGIDHFVTSLREAVKACLDEAVRVVPEPVPVRTLPAPGARLRVVEATES